MEDSEFYNFETTLMPELTNGTSLTVSDYIEIVYNLTAMVIGIPINIWALHGHVKTLRSRPAHARLIWLSIHLAIANLMILLIYSAGTVSTMLTYYWYFGDFCCRLFKCLSIMSFHISSNVVVSIALDMFFSLYAPLRSQIQDGRKRVRLFLVVSWTLASLTALPQLYVWGEMIYDNNPHCAFLFNSYEIFTRAYNLTHLLCVFYIPLVFILFCYLGSAYYVWKHLRLQSHLIQHEVDNNKRKQSVIGSSAIMMKTTENNNHYNYRRQSTVSFLQQQQQRRRNSNIERQTRTKMRLVRKSASVIGGYIICWLPYQIFSVWQSFCDEECENKNFEIITTKLRWLEALMISCACINPFLYTFVRYRPTTNSNADSPRRGSNDVQATISVHKRDSIFMNGKRDSLLTIGNANNQQHSQLLALRRASFGTPKHTMI